LSGQASVAFWGSAGTRDKWYSEASFENYCQQYGEVFKEEFDTGLNLGLLADAISIWVYLQGTQGLGEGLQQPAELLKQLQAQLPGVAAGDGGPSAAAKLQDTLAALKDSLAGAAASQEAQRQNIEKTFSSMSEMAGWAFSTHSLAPVALKKIE